MWLFRRLPIGDGSKDYPDNHKMTKNFTYGEFKCPDCGTNHTSKTLIYLLQNARDHTNVDAPGTSFIINSAYRCPRYNKKVGGKSDSAHMVGLAADIRCRDNRTRYAMIRGLIKAGAVRLGVYKTFIHIDVSSTKPQIRLWL